MLKLSASSRLIKYAYSLDLGFIPSSISLCTLAWRLALVTCVYATWLAASIACLILVVGLTIIAFHHKVAVLGWVGGIFLIIFLFNSTLVRAGVEGIKGRFCPIIHIED